MEVWIPAVGVRDAHTFPDCIVAGRLALDHGLVDGPAGTFVKHVGAAGDILTCGERVECSEHNKRE